MARSPLFHAWRVAAVALLTVAWPRTASSATASTTTCTLIDTVDALDVTKYLGRWYQTYGNIFTIQTVLFNTECVTADYGLDEASGNITIINSSTIPFTGDRITITGIGYGTTRCSPWKKWRNKANTCERGQLEVQLEGQDPAPYWVVGLGPATFGPDELYEWAIVSDPKTVTLFILARDVEDFEANYAEEVLALADELGFNDQFTSPVPIEQDNCADF